MLATAFLLTGACKKIFGILTEHDTLEYHADAAGEEQKLACIKASTVAFHISRADPSSSQFTEGSLGTGKDTLIAMKRFWER